MLLLTRKHLLLHKGRFLLAIAGVACAVVLEVLLMGLYAGWRTSMQAYLRHVQADVWVGQQGAYDLFNTLSLLPEQGRDLFHYVPGIADVAAFVGRLVTCTIRGQQRSLFIVGVERSSNGPVEVVAGRAELRDGEIIVDRVFAREAGLRLSDTLVVARQTLSVVGIARGDNVLLYQYAFVTFDQARRLLGLDGLVNYFLLRLAPTARAEVIAAHIEAAQPRVAAIAKEQFISDNLRLPGDSFLPILRVLESIGWLVGTVVIGLTIYTMTLERSAEYGVLKALGAPDRTLYMTVSLQALICGLLGWLAAIPGCMSLIVLVQCRHGRIRLLLGPSGAGKTTLLSLIGGLLRPTSGTITVANTGLHTLSWRQLTSFRLQHIGFVFQFFQLLLALSARENVEVVLRLGGATPRQARQQADAWLDRFGLRQRLHHLPAQLSGGEKQRLALARALALAPPLIIADEPTGSLDSRSGEEVIRHLRHVVDDKQHTVLIASHDLRIVPLASRVLHCEDEHLSQEA